MKKIICAIIIACFSSSAMAYKIVESKQFRELTKKRVMTINGIDCGVKPETFKAKSASDSKGFDLMCTKYHNDIICKLR